MLRRPFPVKSLLRPRRACNPCEKRHSSSSTGSSAGRKLFLGLVGTTTVGVGGAIAYAKYDPSFRKTLNETVPFSEDVLTPLIGPPEDSSKPSPSRPSLKPQPAAPISTKTEDSSLKRKLEREKAKSANNPVTGVPPPPPLEIPKGAEKRVAGEASKQEAFKATPQPNVEGGISQKSNKTDDSSSVKPAPVKSAETETKEKKPQVPAEKPSLSKSEVSSNLGKGSEVHTHEEKYDQPPFLQGYSNKLDELEKEFDKKVDLVRDEYERELTKQLKRQMAAHLDHLRDQLEVQKAEIERRQSLIEEDKVLAIKDRYYHELSGALNKLNQIETVLKAREKLDEEEIRARKLWLLCQSLKDTMKCNGLKDPIPLKDEVEAMMQTVKALSINSSMTLNILSSIPKAAVEEGVYNEDSLVERFHKVDKLCKRVALIGDEGGSLGQYLLSYLQSVMVTDKVNIPDQELTGANPVDPSQWDTFEVLARVRYCLSQRNIEQALRYANQLKGAPRKVAKDWIKDTRTHLEVRQATELLQALATTITLRSVK